MKTRLLIFFLMLSAGWISAQENLNYQLPPKEILALADYERPPSVMMDEAKTVMVFTYRNTYKTLEDLSQTELRLGGLRVNPITNISSRITYVNNLKIKFFSEKAEVQVQGLPASPQLAYFAWSPDQTKMAFTHTTEQGVELWILNTTTKTAQKLTEAVLNANVGRPFTWFTDSQKLLIRSLPANRPKLIDQSKDMPTGPVVSNTSGRVSQNRTYQDLLKNPTDEANFESLLTSELVTVDLSGNKSVWKKADMYVEEDFSPDGQYLMITTLQKPFSYLVPMSRFPQKSTVFNLSGSEVKVVNETPLREIQPKGFMATFTGKRAMNWRSDKPASLYYVEALDGGDPANKVAFRDELFSWDAPFDKSPVSLAKIPQRFDGVLWGNDTHAVLYDEWYDTRNTKTYLFNPSNPAQKPVVISDRNSQDVYADPGNFETKRNAFKRYVLAIENNKAFLIGDGFSHKGQFPFIDEMDLNTRKTKRLYQSAYTDKQEEILSIEDFKKGTVLVRIQSKTEFPNYYFRNFKNSKKLTQLTDFPNPFKSLEGVYKEVIKYTRNDGVKLSGTLYLPAGYDRTKKEKLPLLIWAYPIEFVDKNSAGQNTQSPNTFTFPSYGSFIYWVTRGYAVLDDAAFPIVGEGENEPNDTFIQQLVANADAAINAVDKLGYIDRNRVGVGGHSYGAFMTSNLLTHSNLFACGIARSGAYNRTLTPFGFQREQRNYWDNPTLYNTMSPFMNAHKMKKPILLIHGEADNNPGTFTLQTERYFQAIKGLGGNARMVILPKESHGYAARENIMHLLWEQDQFLEKYLKPQENKDSLGSGN